MIENLNYVKTLSEHLESVEDPVHEKDLIILISSLSEDYNYLITALETVQYNTILMLIHITPPPPPPHHCSGC